MKSNEPPTANATQFLDKMETSFYMVSSSMKHKITWQVRCTNDVTPQCGYFWRVYSQFIKQHIHPHTLYYGHWQVACFRPSVTMLKSDIGAPGPTTLLYFVDPTLDFLGVRSMPRYRNSFVVPLALLEFLRCMEITRVFHSFRSNNG
jgi:hypothetical protein